MTLGHDTKRSEVLTAEDELGRQETQEPVSQVP